ncbi:MAG: discoidin domain-containing protein [Flavobacteriaceae bacterium]|nr:discoidin domain-containing protein [Flavobacteriaceae bacterium]
MKSILSFLSFWLMIVASAQCSSIEIERSAWSILEFSTQEQFGEGPNNGRAIHTIDGNNNTHWHSRWQNFTNQYPHFITIDMGQNYAMNGLSVTSRFDTSNSKVKQYELFLSTDGTDWEPVQSAGNFVYPLINATGQTAEISFGAITARYFKLVIHSNYDDNVHCAVSEIRAFQIDGTGCTATGQNNQILVFDEIPQHYSTDEPFALQASSNTSQPIIFELISGPASVSGSTVSLTGQGGTVTIKASQAANDTYYAAEAFQSFDVIDLSTISPQIQTRLTENYPIEMPQLYAYKLTANANIAEEEALSVISLQFIVNGELIETREANNSYYAWWTPTTYGMHDIQILATASNGNISTENYQINVTSEVATREVVTLQNAVIDWGTQGSQWFYGTYEMPQFTGAYEQIMAEFNVTCPSVPGGCDDWDRLGYLQIKNPDGEWVELIRYITPYGVACSHELDVTDFASLLQGKVEFRMYIDTWGTGGWQMELILHYLEGTPEFIYSEIEEVWHGTYNFGDMANLQPVPQAQILAPEGTESAGFRVVTTGHGWGANNTGNAAEFYHAIHRFKVNEANTFTQNMRVRCNPNPDGCTGQMGTWQYDRAGWCPGTIAKPYLYDTTPYIQNEYSFDYEFQTSYRDYCHPNNPNCVSGQTCADCNDGYNPHYRIAAYNVFKGNNPLGTLSTREINNIKENKLSVFPNPSQGIFRMQLAEEMENAIVQIYTPQGISLKKYSFKNKEELHQYTFDVSELPAGIYFIKIYNIKQMETSKLLIK